MGIVRKKMEYLRNEAGTAKSFFHIVTFQIDVRIDFVGEAVIPFVAFESDIVSRRADPQRFAVHGEWRLPNAQMITGPDDVYGFGVCPAIILRTAEEI